MPDPVKWLGAQPTCSGFTGNPPYSNPAYSVGRMGETVTIGQWRANTEPPLFVYGNLKPGELGFDLIAKQVARTRAAKLQGNVWVRDGVPLISLNSGDRTVSGYILSLSKAGTLSPRSNPPRTTGGRWRRASNRQELTSTF